jgi:hypothetical protein
MTIVTAGSGATIQSDNAEQQLLDCIALIKGWEKGAQNPNKGNTINCSFGLGSSLAVVSFQVPAAPSINSDGQQVQSAIAYLINTNFTPGTGGTFKSTSVEAYFLEVLTFLEIVEANTTKNPSGVNNVASSFDSDGRVVTGTANIPFTFEIDNGFIKFMADEYLLD